MKLISSKHLHPIWLINLVSKLWHFYISEQIILTDELLNFKEIIPGSDIFVQHSPKNFTKSHNVGISFLDLLYGFFDNFFLIDQSLLNSLEGTKLQEHQSKWIAITFISFIIGLMAFLLESSEKLRRQIIRSSCHSPVLCIVANTNICSCTYITYFHEQRILREN